ncbi:hypothetical protein ABZV81_11290 [Streptomyces parvus]|uniref:hypothetical protein n=1 Tax=Streptomyces parvus TaxID=66428 RepID=UPI0033B808FB
MSVGRSYTRTGPPRVHRPRAQPPNHPAELPHRRAGRFRRPRRPRGPGPGRPRPETGPTVVARLTEDPDPAVRAVAARHPNLPQPRLAALLDDEELAHHAAANAALPPDTIRRLLRTDGRTAGRAAGVEEDPAPDPRPTIAWPIEIR